MTNLKRTSLHLSARQAVPVDPGNVWVKDQAIALDAPPDDDSDPHPESTWPVAAKRSGICGVVSPRVVAIPAGGYRLYYSQILPRTGFPAGACDYDNASCRILSAKSVDGETWIPEPGIRLTSSAGGAGEYRVVSSEVVQLPGGYHCRMYYECCEGPQSITNSIRSALSSDGGLTWNPEPGNRLARPGHTYAAPRIQFLDETRCRLYCLDRGAGIVSAISHDGGLTFAWESGVRIAQDGPHDSLAAFAPEILRLQEGGYVMYYSGYSATNRAQILRAISADGLNWEKELQPALLPGPEGWDAVKCSEMTIFRLPDQPGRGIRFRMLYEACDGTAPDARGVWRIGSATAERPFPTSRVPPDHAA